MTTFEYTARAKDGTSFSGELAVASKKEAMLQLRSRGLQPVTIEESTGKKKKKVVGKVNVTNKDIIMFTEELSELLKAGLPLEPALASMESRDDEGMIKDASGKLRNLVTDGVPLNVALTKVSSKFDALYCNLIAAGEASGSLASIITQHAKYMKERAELRSRLLFTMMYPAFLGAACIVVALVFLFYLLPQIADLLSSMDGQKMPLGIKFSIILGDFLKANWLYLLGLLLVVVFALKMYFDSEENKAVWDGKKCKLPFYGNVVCYGFYVQWLKTLSNLLSNGVPMVQSLDLTRETVQNRYFKSELSKVSEKVKDGLKLTSSMKQVGIFPAAMVDLIAVGDQTGKMDKAVKRASEYYENKLGLVLKAFMGIITPVILLGMALLVFVLCSTMLQAIIGASEGMRN